ncbi:hypothetical protein [uncultured Methylobacterium sp.]|jgi:hypothetical protein|uniref:hypothetical protein n=1 Tax=uncultured Methylobacterium sp. TaxID=157278 RepID=UPI00262DAE12|nr:hypothetical protein [uncultured Methylobacterium sp.]
MIRRLLAALLVLAPPAAAEARDRPTGDPTVQDDLRAATIEQPGTGTGTPAAPIASGTPASGIWSSGTWHQRYHSAADWGNTTPVSSQWLARCTTTSDATVYESCVNIDFYNRTGAAGPWTAATATPAGAFVQIDGGHFYRAARAGTTGAKPPAWPKSGSVTDGSVVWEHAGDGTTAAKSGLSLSSVSTAGGGNHWLLNPNCIIGKGFRSQLYCVELDVGNDSGFDWTPGAAVPGPQALWIGGVTTNTGAAAINIGSQHSTAGKPAWYFGLWCGNALAAGQTCFEDWSNAVTGFHTASFARKTYDIHLQASSVSGVKLDGRYSNSGINLENATVSGAGVAVPTAIRIKAGQGVCFDGSDRCFFYEASSQKLIYQRGATRLFSIDGAGNLRAAGTIRENVAP